MTTGPAEPDLPRVYAGDECTECVGGWHLFCDGALNWCGCWDLICLPPRQGAEDERTPWRPSHPGDR